MNKKARIIAFYLPQFHPIPENDEWWGKGFTEWTNVGKAKPLFKGHYQPRVPADLGYYDLRMPEVRELQAEMAKNYGIEGFMYWHYWFGNGKTILERPFKEVLESGKPDFPFCLGWANHSWTSRTWLSNNQYKPNSVLMEQLYPGKQDFIDHFYYVLKAFKDKRYITVDDKPIFYIFNPLEIINISLFTETWQSLAKENGLKGIHFVGQAHRIADCKKLFKTELNGICRTGMFDAADKIKGLYANKILWHLRERFKLIPLDTYKYSDIIENFIEPEIDKMENVYPTIIPNYVHSPRSGRKGLIINESSPELFKTLIKKTVDIIQHKKEQQKIIFLRSWNEWAEGNYVEPDLVHGHGYLKAIKEEIIG